MSPIKKNIVIKQEGAPGVVIGAKLQVIGSFVELTPTAISTNTSNELAVSENFAREVMLSSSEYYYYNTELNSKFIPEHGTAVEYQPEDRKSPAPAPTKIPLADEKLKPNFNPDDPIWELMSTAQLYLKEKEWECTVITDGLKASSEFIDGCYWYKKTHTVGIFEACMIQAKDDIADIKCHRASMLKQRNDVNEIKSSINKLLIDCGWELDHHGDDGIDFYRVPQYLREADDINEFPSDLIKSQDQAYQLQQLYIKHYGKV